jgi:hypothetical protein
MTRVRRQIPIPELDGDPDADRIWCNWSDCDNPASSLHTAVECFANPGIRNHPEHPRRPECSECRRLAFCSAQCMDYHLRSHRPGAFGKLSPGTNRRYL